MSDVEGIHEGRALQVRERKGALLTTVLLYHPSLERCRPRRCCVELLQRVMSLLPLKEGC